MDEDLPPRAAEIAWELGVDVVSVHEVSRAGIAISDPDQLRLAARERRIFVMRNRDDFIRHTREFYGKGEPHGGLLIVTGGLPANKPDRIARAIQRWEKSNSEHPESFGPYNLDFLRESSPES